MWQEISSKAERYISKTEQQQRTVVLFLNETIDQLAMANNVRWYGYVLRREDEVKGQRKKHV